MDHRDLAALTAVTLLLLHLQTYLLPGPRGTAAPLGILAQYEATRAAELRRLGIEFADSRTVTVASSGPGLPDALAR